MNSALEEEKGEKQGRQWRQGEGRNSKRRQGGGLLEGEKGWEEG